MVVKVAPVVAVFAVEVPAVEVEEVAAAAVAITVLGACSPNPLC